MLGPNPIAHGRGSAGACLKCHTCTLPLLGRACHRHRRHKLVLQERSRLVCLRH